MFNEFCELIAAAVTEVDWVFFRVIGFAFCFKGSAYVGVDGIIAVGNSKAVAEQVGGFSVNSEQLTMNSEEEASLSNNTKPAKELLQSNSSKQEKRIAFKQRHYSLFIIHY